MSKSKAYSSQDPTSQNAKEPMMEYRSSDVMGEVKLLSDEIIIGAIKYAQIARENERVIPNDQVYRLLADRLGWK